MAEIREGTARNRGAGRPFEKGQSGNPGGRPKSAGPLRELAREHTEEALGVLVAALSDEDARVRISAATALLDRGHGRPTAPIGIDLDQSAEAAPEETASALEIARGLAFVLQLGMRERAAQNEDE